MLKDDNRFWHWAAWPTLFVTAIYLVLSPIPRADARTRLVGGRKFTYANEPPSFATLQSGYTQNAWARERALLSRPYGQMLWLPGRSTAYQDFIEGVYPEDTSTEGYLKVQQYRGATPDGSIACLKLEDGTFLLFNWDTGALLRQDHGDAAPNAAPIRKVDFNIATGAVTDNLGRSIAVHRNSKGFIEFITDPRGFSFTYEYNAADELSRIVDRAGGVRRLYYEKPDYPHYLTRMVIERGGGQTTEIKYDYDHDARLGNIDTGAGEIGMEYADQAGGSGIQTVVDKATGGRTEVHYDSAGRVTKQVDAAGVVQSYEYFPDDSANFNTQPPGVLRSQISNGIETQFSYDLSPYQPQSFGIEGIAHNFVDFWLNRASGGEIVNDYPGNPPTLRPGYLTSQQVQPTEVKTPAIENGVNVGQNVVSIAYSVLGGGLPDGTGKIYGVDDPEGRHVGLGYGSGPARNETANVSGPGSPMLSRWISAQA